MSVAHLSDYRQPQQPTPDRAPPASIEAEQALLGAAMHSVEAFHVAAAIVRMEHFAEEIHRRIFDVMGGLVREGRSINPPALVTYLGNGEIAEGVTVAQYLARLAAEAVMISGASDYARTIRDLATRRSLIEAGEKIVDEAHGAVIGRSPDDIAADGLGAIRQIVEVSDRKKTRFGIGDGMAALIDRVERIRRGEERTKVMSTGFLDLDRAMAGGLRPSTIVVVAGRPGAGKSVLMTNLAFNMASRGVGVLEFSLELPDDEIRARHTAQVIYDRRKPVSYSAIEQATTLDDSDLEAMILAQRDLADVPLVIECPPTISPHEIAARIHVEKRRMAQRGVDLGVVLIDYLDKISASDRYAGQRTYEVQEIVTALKSAARAEEVCVVLLAQLNRGTEGREDKRPSLADIKSSSFLEQEAHAVIFIYREAYYLAKSAEYRNGDVDAQHRYEQVKHDLELIIGKNRSGPEKTVHLWADVACSVLSSKAER